MSISKDPLSFKLKFNMMTRYDGTNYQIPTPLDGVARRALQQLTSIYYGHTRHPWAVPVDNEEEHHAIFSSAKKKEACSA